MNRARVKDRHEWLEAGRPLARRPCPIYHSQTRRPARRPAGAAASAAATLVLEDRGLPIGAPAIAAGCAVGADDAMARHDQRDRVGGAGLRHRARRGRPADRLRHLLVGAHLAVGNRPERTPHLLLERGAADVDGRAVLGARRQLPADRGDVRAQAGVRRRPARRGETRRRGRLRARAASSPSITRQTPRSVAATSSCPNGVGVTTARIRSPAPPRR